MASDEHTGTPACDNGLPTICQSRFVNFLPHLHDWLTTTAAGIIAGAMTQHGHKNTQQSVANSASSLAMALPLGSQCGIYAVEVRIALHGDSGHVIQRMAQARVTPTPHHDLSAFATLLG